MGFDAAIHVFAGGRQADAKSLLAVLGLGARRDTELRLGADGPDADSALAALVTCIAGLVE